MGKIRSFQLPQDVDTMASLLKDGFHYPENPAWSVQDDETENMHDQVKSIKRIWPLIRTLQLFAPFLRDIMLGFIYEEDDKPVGLINFGRQKKIPEWFVGNVTVLPKYRRRGIARELVAAALKELQAREAKIAALEVIADNIPAYNLYKEMGFSAYSGSSDYEIQLNESVAVPPLEHGFLLTHLKLTEWKTKMDFAERVTPAEIRRYEPIREDRFKPSPVSKLIGPLLNMLNGSKVERISIFKDNQVVGTGSYIYRTRAGGVNHAKLQVDPEYPEITSFAIRSLLASVQRNSPGRRLEINLQNWQPALLQAAEEAGCNKRYAYHQMAILFP